MDFFILHIIKEIMRRSDSFQEREDIVYYRVKGSTYLDIHGLMAIVKMPYSTTYRKTKQILDKTDEEFRVKYMGRDLYDMDFCFSWWQYYSELKLRGEI